jgi:hypothetical protein
VLEDEDRLLQDIFSSQIRVTENHASDYSDQGRLTYETRTVSQIIEMGKNSAGPDYFKTLQAYGISYCEDAGYFFQPSQVARNLLRDIEPWRGLNIGSILLRIDGAVKTTRRMAGQPQRGILIPFACCRLDEDGVNSC